MNERTPLLKAIASGKADEWSKIHGGFTVYRLSNDAVDYFPFGQPANIAGEVDRAATLLARFRWNMTRWSRID
jgi:hypothetical protein